jgi:RNA polymerase sigma factor (sigma-70 family)
MSAKPPATLAELLATLPEEERFILTLHYIKGLPSSEIASALGVPVKAVDSVIARGRARILGSIPLN